MRLLALFTVVCLCSSPALAQLGNQLTGNSQAQNLPPENKKGSAKAAPSNLQLEFRVPFDPTVFPSGSHSYLVYEIHLTNFLPALLSLRRIEVLDARIFVVGNDPLDIGASRHALCEQVLLFRVIVAATAANEESADGFVILGAGGEG